MKKNNNYNMITLDNVEHNLQRYGFIKHNNKHYVGVYDTTEKHQAMKVYDMFKNIDQAPMIVKTTQNEKALYYVVVRKEDNNG